MDSQRKISLERCLAENKNDMSDNEDKVFCGQFVDFPNSFLMKDQRNLDAPILKRLQKGLESALSAGHKTSLETARAYNLLAFVLFRLKQPSQALEKLDCALATEGQQENIVSLANKSTILWKLGSIAASKSQLGILQGLKLKGNYFHYLVVRAKAELAFSYTRLGPKYSSTAISAFEEILPDAREPEKYLWTFGLALTLRRATRVQLAPHASSPVDTTARDLRILALLKEVICNSDKNLQAKAYAEIGLLLSNNRKSKDLLQAAGMTAVEACEKALELDDTDNSVLCKSSRIFRYFNRDLDLCCTLLIKATSIRPSATAFHHLGLTYKVMATRLKYSPNRSAGHVHRNDSRESQGWRRQLFGERRIDSRPRDTKSDESNGNSRVKENDHGVCEEQSSHHQCQGQRATYSQLLAEWFNTTGLEGQGSGHFSSTSLLLSTDNSSQNSESPINSSVSDDLAKLDNISYADVKKLGAIGIQQRFDGLSLSTVHESLASDVQPASFTPQPESCALQLQSCTSQLKSCIPQPESSIPQPVRCTPQPFRCIPQSESCTPQPESYISQPADCTLWSVCCTPQPESCIPQPASCTPQLENCASQLESCTPQPVGYTPEPESYNPQPESYIPQPESYTLQAESCTPQPVNSTPATDQSNSLQNLKEANPNHLEIKILQKQIKSPTKETKFSREDKYVREAFQYFQKAVDFSEDENTRVLYDLALMYKALGEYQEALEILKKLRCANVFYIGSIDRINAFEQSGFILEEMIKTETSEENKQRLTKEKKDMFHKALSLQSDLYSKNSQVQGLLGEVWHSFEALFSEVDQCDMSRESKLKEKAKLLHLIRKHKESSLLLQELESMSSKEEIQADFLEMRIKNCVELGQYSDAVTALDLMKLVKDESQESTVLESFKDKNFVQKIYLEAGRQTFLGDSPAAQEHFRSALCYCFERNQQASSSSEDTNSTDGLTSDVTWDVMVIHDSQTYAQIKTAHALARFLHKSCGLLTTRLEEDAPTGPEEEGVLAIMKRSKLVVVVAGEEHPSKEFRTYIRHASHRSSTVLLLMGGDQVPKLLKRHRSMTCPPDLLDLVLEEREQYSEGQVNVICNLMCFFMGI